jgi:Domain of unknown function (DUF4190)
MKRCPNCNRTFEEDWLAFCTQDGTTLIDESPAKPDEPPPTIMAPAPPPSGWQQPSGGLGSGQFPSQPIAPPPPPSNLAQPGGFGSLQQGGWQVPPPPFVQAPKQGIAVASMICGIFSVTFGWCCYLGVITAPVAIGMGIYQLIQIKNKPDEVGGKPFAITGIATGSVYFLGLLIIILIYGGMILLGGMK